MSEPLVIKASFLPTISDEDLAQIKADLAKTLAEAGYSLDTPGCWLSESYTVLSDWATELTWTYTPAV